MCDFMFWAQKDSSPGEKHQIDGDGFYLEFMIIYFLSYIHTRQFCEGLKERG